MKLGKPFGHTSPMNTIFVLQMLVQLDTTMNDLDLSCRSQIYEDSSATLGG